MKANRLFLTAIWVLASWTGAEAKDYVRYVSQSKGAFSNDGSTWASAKDNVQDAINAIKDKLEPGDRGYVFVEAGTYKPTQSVANTSGSSLYMSIQIPAGIAIYGGFMGTETGSSAQAIIDQRETETTNIGTYPKNKTIFTGSLSSDAQFAWQDKKHCYTTSFFGNCYHVVWFATNGYEMDGDVRRYKALSDSAYLDGVVIKDGYAFSSDINHAEHIAFGGGAYMVDKAVMRNCEVYHCEASRGGGGIYMDRGGLVDNCFIHDCQTLGVNSLTGFGGGISIDQRGSVTHSTLLNNVGRSGGGLSINYDATADLDGKGKYAASAACCLVAQNVSIVEAGGVYLNHGGLLNGATIVRNRTYGTGVTLNSIVTGRSGGLYVRDHARIYNSVLWGNMTTARNTYNLQYAATRSSASNDLKPLLTYVALSKADYTDWSGTKKVGISKLSDEDIQTFAVADNFAMFKAASDSAGHINYLADKLYSSAQKYAEMVDWTPTASSALCYAGLQLLDIVESEGIDLSAGFIEKDLKGNAFNPKCTLGAYTAEAETPKDTEIDGIRTIFVDPDRDSGVFYREPGISWDSPMDNLTDALAYFARNNYEGQILVKEGTLYTASRSAQGRLRNTTVQMASNVTVKGGYPRELTGTDVETTISGATLQRNPIVYPTIITGKVVDKDYQSNVAHLVTFDGVQNAVLDGFQLRYGNASSTAITDYGKDGAGVRVLNGASATLRNVTIADCTAEKGAAIYQESGTLICENCIVRNNESSTTTATLSGGVIYTAAGATTSFDHCDVVRNVGHAVVSYGRFTSTNSFYYSNMCQAIDDTNNHGDLALPVFLGNATFSGSHNLFDRKSENVAEARKMAKVMDKGQTVWMDWYFDVYSQSYPRFVNATKNAGVSEDGDVTYYGREVDYTPSDMNPVVNAASTNGVAHRTGFSDDSWGKDMTAVANRDFGGLPDIGALENGAFSAGSATQPSYGTTYYVRDYNTYTYGSDGSIISTLTEDLSMTHSDGTPRNGMSWQNAINGNAVYSNKSVTRSVTVGAATTTIVSSNENESLVSRQKYVITGLRNGDRCYIRCNNGVFESCTDINQADEFIFVKTANSESNSMYRIYDVTQKGYVNYQAKEEYLIGGINLVDNSGNNTDWQIRFGDDGAAIAPAWSNYATGWNIYDENGRLSLYKVDGETKSNTWNIHPSTETLTTTSPFINGLQYAVNTAESAMPTEEVVTSAIGYSNSEANDIELTFRNLVNSNQKVAVWVAAGLYTNPDGYQIRNHVKVYGGFPKVGNPGMNERHPQLSYGIPLSSENQNLGLRIQDYETILQTNKSIEERDNQSTSVDQKSVSVLSQPQECRVTESDYVNEQRNRVVYEGAEWDGFTMRFGWKIGVTGSGGGRRNGGSGVSLYENVVLRNCIVRENRLTGSNKGDDQGTRDNSKKDYQSKGRGAGIYCDGSTVENCFVLDNLSDCTFENFGGGIYMIKGTMYNTVVTENRLSEEHTTANHGNGVFFESANFYNNTIVNNHGGTSAIGVWTASAAESHLTVYNSIVMGNDTVPILYLANASLPAQFDHCFLQTSNAQSRCGEYSNVKVTESAVYVGNAPSEEYLNPFALKYEQAVQNRNYRIKTKGVYNCVNKGTEQLGEDPYTHEKVVLPSHDMDWTRRVQDCRVDIGAYEYNGAGEITPDTDPSRVAEGTAVYYVSELGFGTTQAFDPANAACAEKLQKVLDAAGRYKYDHPEVKVIVKLAGVDATAKNSTGKSAYNENTCFKYYPCRTTDETSDNVRAWSIMVPRGVEVWGGYCVDQVLDETTNDKIAPYFSEDERSVMYHPTYLQTEYDNSNLNETIKGYHVVTFTDKVFDSDGREIAGALLSSKGFTDRAVLDGLFLVGGQADGSGFGSTSSTVNIDQYGGAAIVTDYAHVRNCIVKNNTATYGGALALMNKGLVSGSLIIDNSADYGGGVYVIEDEVTMSNGSVNNTTHETGESLDAKMPHVYTSTIIKNTGVQQGGGLWFSNDADEPNVRVNSTVLWENISPDQANVAGQTSPSIPTDISNVSTLEWYPFAYSAVQNQRLSGTSNISVDIQNLQGNRFGIDSRTDSTVYNGMDIAADTTEVDFYGLTVFSALCRTGMPNETYQALVNSLGLAARDYNQWSRDTIPAQSYDNVRNYIDIGARAYPSSPILDLEHPFLRLYVAETQDVNMDAYQTIQDYAYTLATKAHNDESFVPANDPNYIYSLLGSSFAFPFHNIDDALTYITALRKTNMWEGRANNLPFEICIARGEYYPQRDMEGNYGYSLANTYLIPEGVTLMGGFDCNDLYGQYLKPRLVSKEQYTADLTENVERYSAQGDTLVAVSVSESFAQSVRLIQLPLDSMASRRILEDLNMNNILEPWEYRNQTNLSGNAVNLQNSGVYHVVSVIPYAPGVGQLPLPTYTNNDYAGHEGYQSRYVGQPVIIDGVHISDGYARDYVNGSLTDNGIYDYYRGGGLRANGNWYCENLDGQGDALYHQDVPDAVAYRDIPLYIRNSQFVNNQAGYGAAIDANVSTYIYTSLFAANKATSKTETVAWGSANNTLSYPGNGGAIYYNNRLEAYNTIFSNNEAEDKGVSQLSYKVYQSLQGNEKLKSFGGAGGALCGGYNSHLKMLNCDVVNNKACIYPAIFTKNPNRISPSVKADQHENDYNVLANDVFWGNAVVEGLTTGTPLNPFAQALCINYAKASADNSRYDIDLSKAPFSQAQLDTDFVETLWFSGYEDGKAKSAVNMNDLREAHYKKDEFFGQTLQQYWLDTYVASGKSTYVQNANIILSSTNATIEGPNFRNPTTKAGYDGYSEAADWSRARINNLTDNGSCFLTQNVQNKGLEGYVVSWQTDSRSQYVGDGVYYDTYYDEERPENRQGMDLGGDIYMRSADEYQNLPRVAQDPNPIRTKAYIDLGVYEYPYCRLVPTQEGDATDILWVSTTENPENGTPDGSKWETPTSDLQRAIETLMSSRNGHRKEIRLMDGEYMPVNTYDDHKTFYINTKDMNNSVTFPQDAYLNGQLNIDASNVQEYCIQSLTIKGGYSKDLRDQYDTELYPAVIRQSERKDATSETWDYLFLIDDATQRYGQGLMEDGGAFVSSGDTATTVPVEIDGVTLVNNQALPGTHGTALRYNDQVFSYVDNNGDTHTIYADAPDSAYVTISQEEYNELKKDPSVKLYCSYWDPTYTHESSEETPYVLYYRKVDNPPKVIISKTCVMNSGNYDADTNTEINSSAVYIGQYGGDGLIYNSVFHSNWGNPLEAYNTRTINNTVALNRGRWILKNSGATDVLEESGSGSGTGEMLSPLHRAKVVHKNVREPRHSNIMNTILWRNNPQGTGDTPVYGNQFALDGYVSETDAASDSIFKRNAYTYYNNGVIDVTEDTDYDNLSSPLALSHWNTHLSLANDNISFGPNFKAPILDASSDEEIESRDFSLMPSIRIINKGETSIYANQVFDLAWVPTTELDFINQPRVISMSIEVGAIEYQQPLLRVLYVDPNKTENGSGIDWGSTINSTHIQDAIDQAALYAEVNTPIKDENGNVIDRNEAYVFIKGNNELTFPGITLRSGVNVYGSIDPSNVTDSVRYSLDENGDYTYPNLKEDVETIVTQRPGLLIPGTKRTIISSVNTGENNTFSVEKPTRLDGVVISAQTDENPSGAISSPVLDIDAKTTTGASGQVPALALSHIMVADNDASGSTGVNIANINNALIYEVLFRDNKTSNGSYVLNLGDRAYGVNLTVEGLTNDAAGKCVYPTTDDKAQVQASHIWYSIYNYSGKPADENTLSAYNYEVEDPNLNYQLTEFSTNIDRCPKVNPMTLQTETRNLVEFINYNTDVDLLGNPRVLDTSIPVDGKSLDRGAFETWRIGNDVTAKTVYSNTEADQYYGNYYPHEGSVVYLMKNSNLISEAHELIPSYLLVKQGASLFSHGQTVKVAYVGVEREVKHEGTVVAVPYAMEYNYRTDNSHGSATFAYAADGVLTLTNDPATATYSYDGSKRAASRYQINNSNSPCWNILGAEAVDACQGVLFTSSQDAAYRFTGKGASMKDYIYLERLSTDASGNVLSTAKEVTLTPYNNEPTDGNGNLTAAEDMGWNCFGIPYLVSEYKPYEKAKDSKYNVTATSAEYRMHLPKQLWLYYDGAIVKDLSSNNWTTQNAKNYAGFYAVESWKSTAEDWHLKTGAPALWVGEGMFTQTASYDEESLLFYLPIYNEGSHAAPVRHLQRLYVGDGIEDELDPSATLENTIYDLQGRKVLNPSTHGIYIVNGKRVWL